MNRKKFNQVRVIITLFVFLIVILAVLKNSYLLSVVAILTGFVFTVLARSKYKPQTDERQVFLHLKSAQLAYAIFTPTIAFTSAILLFPSLSKLPVFDHGEFAFLDAIGIIFAYLSLFLITVYAISYHFYNKKY